MPAISATVLAMAKQRGNGGISEEGMESILAEALYNFSEDSEQGVSISLRTFQEVGILTNKHGLVVRAGRSMFQITIVKAS